MKGKYPDKPKLQDGWHDVRIERLFEYEKNGTQGVGVVMLNSQGHEGLLFVRNHFGQEEWSDKKWGRLFAAMGQEGKESRSDRNEQVKSQYGTPLRVKVDEGKPGMIGMVLPLEREDKKQESFEDVPF